MSWKEDLKAQLEAVARDRALPGVHESDADRRTLLWQTMRIAEKVLKFASTQLPRAKYVSDEVLRLSLAHCMLELRLMVNGLAINVRRETGVIDLLHVERGTLVDGRRSRISSIEGYFAGRVVDLAADSNCLPPTAAANA